MQPSTIQLDEFNDCPGTLQIRTYLARQRLEQAVEVVDLPKERAPYYANNTATLVLALKQAPREAVLALAVGQMASDCQADEFTWVNVDGRLVVRLWWD